jgi:hypothetical protein
MGEAPYHAEFARGWQGADAQSGSSQVEVFEAIDAGSAESDR